MINRTKEILDKLKEEGKISIVDIDMNSFKERMSKIREEYRLKEFNTIISASKTPPFNN